ncbi:MAG: DUF3035 domain-containing protein [Proteobacteria bacterium]|nr:DUF3035 domain-containing protein [Pseudomonadota bacterium]
MNKTLLFLLTLAAFGCSGRKAPDESMVIIRTEKIHLPPEYELLAPEDVKSIKKENSTIQETSKSLLLGAKKAESKSNENSWLVNKAGGESRVKNIKKVLKEEEKSKK